MNNNQFKEYCWKFLSQKQWLQIESKKYVSKKLSDKKQKVSIHCSWYFPRQGEEMKISQERIKEA